MSALSSETGSSSKADAEDEITYQILLSTLLAIRGYNFSIDGKYKDSEFSICREPYMSLDGKIHYIIFSYKDIDGTKNLVFVYAKHKQSENQEIDYEILSAEEWEANEDLRKDFNIKNLFISFLSIKEELKNNTSEELKDAAIKHVAMYTNIGLNSTKLDLKSNLNDDTLNDFASIFTFEKSSRDLETCYQLNDDKDKLRKILENFFDVYCIARELALYAVRTEYRENNILGKGDAVLNSYQAALKREVIEKSTEELSEGKEAYCVAKFKDNFLDNDKLGSKQEFRNQIFSAMREHGKLGMDISDYELKEELRRVKLKVTPYFGDVHSEKTSLPDKWQTIKDRDITDFLNCFVLFVKQPNVARLEAYISENDSNFVGNDLNQAVGNVLQKLKKHIEKQFKFSCKSLDKKKWFSFKKIKKFFELIPSLEEGIIYEKVFFTLLAKRGYELSIDDKFKYQKFSIGRQLHIAPDVKFDDVGLIYEDAGVAKNLIFVQLKHTRKENPEISYKTLSEKEWEAIGNIGEEFYLRKYFVSFLRIKEELDANSELKGGQIKNVAIYTNYHLNPKKLDLKISSDDSTLYDISSFFTFDQSSEKSIICYRLNRVNYKLYKILKKSSDLQRIARELVHYAVSDKHRKKNILGKKETAVNFYQVALKRENVIEITDDEVKIKEDEVESTDDEVNMEEEKYCIAKFAVEFLDNCKTRSQQDLRYEIFRAMRQYAENEKDNDDQLKRKLRKVRLKVTPNFGEIESKKTSFPPKWKRVTKDDIAAFLKCFVLVVNQPNVTNLNTHFSKNVVVSRGVIASHGTDNVLPKLKDRIEKKLGFDVKASHEEKWLSFEEIKQFFLEIEEANIISLMTVDEDKVMQYGNFVDFGKLAIELDNFLEFVSDKKTREHGNSKKLKSKKSRKIETKSKLLCVSSENTQLSSIKILEYFVKKDYRTDNGLIFIELSNLKVIRDRVRDAFSSECHNLLIIECRETIDEKNAIELGSSFSDIIKNRTNKKIILIHKKDELNILVESFLSELSYVKVTDDMNLKDFKPRENPLNKEVIIFQGQKKKISLATLTGFKKWEDYLDYLSRDENMTKTIIADIIIKILNNEEFQVGKKLPGMSSLEGAYTSISEEMKLDTLKDKLYEHEPFEDCSFDMLFNEEISDALVQNHNNEVYIFYGIEGSDTTEKKCKLFQYLGIENKGKIVEDQLGEIGTDNKIQIAGDNCDDNEFKEICCNYPNKMIFLISVNDGKFILQHFYNPNFYLERKFVNVIISVKVKEMLKKKELPEVFIFSCVNNLERLVRLLDLTDKDEEKNIATNCDNKRIILCSSENDAEVAFQELSKQGRRSVHLLKLKENKFIWCQSHGSHDSLRECIEHDKNGSSPVNENILIKEIREKKLVIIADDPGMGKTTTLTKLYESTNDQENSFSKTHWVIRINLREHLQTIRDIESRFGIVNIINVVNFLSKIDLNLNHINKRNFNYTLILSLTKNLLRLALDKTKKFLKPLLLVFDGFDEVPDTESQKKIIALLKFLNIETSAKIWVTTRMHHKKTLENELSTFAIEFVSLDEEVKKDYIKKYLKDNFYFILDLKDFNKHFGDEGERQEDSIIQKYTNSFLLKMEEIFEDNRFIGTPLQLYLMLEISVSHLKKWMKNASKEKIDDLNPDFSYLGTNILEIYNFFFDIKYDIYFRKMGIEDKISKERDKFIFNQVNKKIAKSCILKFKQNVLKIFENPVLSVGIVKSHGNDKIEFIHTTFKDYFAAEMFIHWMNKVPNELSNTNKQEYLLKEILYKQDYKLIRTFMNFMLEKIDYKLLEENSKQYGKIIEKQFREKQTNSFSGEETGHVEYTTVFHIAVEEGNKNLVLFLLNSIKGHSDVLMKILLICDEFGYTALDLACKGDDVEIVNILLNFVAGISADALQELLHESCALFVAAEFSNNVQILKELLQKANNKLRLSLNKELNSLIPACERGKEEFVKTILQEFKNEEHSLKQLLLFKNGCYISVLCSAEKYPSIIDYLLSVAKDIKDNNETLKKLLLPEEGDLPLNRAIERGDFPVTKLLLKAAEDIDDDEYILKLLNDKATEPALDLAVKEGNASIIKLLLEMVPIIYDMMFEEIIIEIIKNGQNEIRLDVKAGHNDIFIDCFKILEGAKYQNIRRKVIDIYYNIPLTDRLSFYKNALIDAIQQNAFSRVKNTLDLAKESNTEEFKILLLAVEDKVTRRNTLNVACRNGHIDIIKLLISYAIDINDEGETLKALLTSQNDENKAPFEEIKKGCISEVKHIVESLILEARHNSNENVVTILQNNQTYREVNYDRLISLLLVAFAKICLDSFSAIKEWAI